MKKSYVFQTIISILVAVAAGGAWMAVAMEDGEGHVPFDPIAIAIALTLLLPFVIYRQYRLYNQHVRKVLFLLDAIENNDNAIHFPEADKRADTRLVNQALNRIARMLYNVKYETAQREKYYELILNSVNTGIVVLNDNGAVYRHNDEALHLLGISVLTHVSQLQRTDPKLSTLFANCVAGDELQVPLHNERGTVNLSVRVSDINIRQEHLRILALNDINKELDKKEIDSWIRLTRVLTHEIMNAVTPITSLSDTLLEQTEGKAMQEDVRHGLQTISSTGKGLLAFVESYRKFTRIPEPKPSLFYVKGFIERMTELARHQYPDARIAFRTSITPDDLILHADENLIAQVVINLLKNAIQAIQSDKQRQEQGIISIQARCNEAESVLIEITNNGPAIPADVAEHIFIPFFTTKEGGSGIGLSISRQIMRLSGGSISLMQGKGETTFVLRFD